MKGSNNLHYIFLVLQKWRKPGFHLKEGETTVCIVPVKINLPPSNIMSQILPNQCLSHIFFSPEFGRIYSKASSSGSLWIKQIIWSWLGQIWHACLCVIFNTCVDVQGSSSCYFFVWRAFSRSQYCNLICMWWRDYNFISEGPFVTLRFWQPHGVLLQKTAHHKNNRPLIISVKTR